MKKVKKLIVLFLAIALSVSIFVTGMGFAAMANAATVTKYSIDGALPNEGYSLVTDDNGKTHKIKQASSVQIGSEVTLPNEVTHIRTPKGNVVKVESHKYTFKELGFYSLIVGAYEGMRIQCVSDGNTMKIVAADVPTYVKAGDEVKLPAATIVDADGEKVDAAIAETFKIEVTYVTPESQTPQTAADNKFSTNAAKAGSYFVRYAATRYSAKVGATGSTELYTLIKDFTVNAQKDFADSEKPTLTVSGVPNVANVRTKVTLPVATAKDNYDENVKVEVSVSAPDGKDLKVYVEEGYALVEKEGKVAFDNDKKMSFYPDQIGNYIVTYTATDDSGNATVSRKLIEVKDGKAPVIVIDDENKIPAEWGLSTMNMSGNVAKMSLPAATAYDNLPFDGTNYSKAATLQIKDPNGDFIYNPTAVTPLNVGDAVTEVKVGDVLKGYTLDLSASGKGAGTYTVIYTAQDAQKLPSTSTFKITVTDFYKVDQNPIINVKNIPDFLKVGDKVSGLSSLNISAYSETKASSSKNAPKVSVNESTFEYGGKTYSVKDLAKESLLLTATGKLKVVVKATDAAGNSAAAETVEINVLDFTAGTAPATTAPSGWSSDTDLGTVNKYFDFFACESDSTDNVFEGSDLGKAMKIVGSTNVGFEAYVSFAADGATQKVNAAPAYVEAEYAYHEEVNGATKSIYISSVRIAKDRLSAGTYTLVVRSFGEGVTGSIYTASVKISSGATGGDPGFDKSMTSVSLLAANDGSVNAYSPKILLKRAPASGAHLGRVIKGSRFSIMGNYLIPMTANQTYTVDSYPVKNVSPNGYEFITQDNKGNRYPETESITTLVSEGITFEIYDAYTSYAEKNSVIKVPDISVISPFGNIVEYKVTVKAPAPNSNAVDSFYSDAAGTVPFDEETGGDRYFKASSNGVYVVTYTASTTTGGGTYTLNITVGDIVKPDLTITNKPSSDTITMKKGDKFKFHALDATDNETSASNLKYKRVLTHPDGTVDGISDEVNTAGVNEATLSKDGEYTVTYTVTDEAGNETKYTLKIVVSSASSAGSVAQTVTITLIVVVSLLIVGLLIYFFVFRKIDFDKKKKKAAAKRAASREAVRKEAAPVAEVAESDDGIVDVDPSEIEETNDSDETDEQGKDE